MPTLQQALAALHIKLHIKPPRPAATPQKPKPKAKPPGPRRVRLGQLGIPMPAVASDGFDRPTPSKPPPEHEANYAERYFP